MPDSPEGGKIVLFVSGRFDILRRLVSVPPAPRSTPVSARQFPRVEDGYPMVREYEPGDFAGRIDPLRSSTKDEPYVRVPHSETTSTHQTTTDNRIRISSNVALSDHRPDEGSWLGKWLIIGICIAIVTLQWESILLSGSLLLTIATVLALEWWFGRGRGGRLAKNGSVICAFVFMVVMTFSTGEMAGAGSVFLIQVLILKRLFPDEGEDAFLFLFLGLFVFVAVSLFALQFWFMAFFLVYLLVALALLRSAAGYSDQFALRSMVHTE
ncbi:MAG TPA: hypothetical protein PK765_07520 [bacterium]|nr:hypothetical protein [bacterium]